MSLDLLPCAFGPVVWCVLATRVGVTRLPPEAESYGSRVVIGERLSECSRTESAPQVAPLSEGFADDETVFIMQEM
jgi:hypothetical protein